MSDVERRSWRRIPSPLWDDIAIAAVWIATRACVLWLGLPPLVQCDSFFYPPFLDAVRDPHYPVLYGMFVQSLDVNALIVLQHLMVLGEALVLCRTGRAAFSRIGGLMTGLFIVLYPGFWLYAQTVMSETVFLFFLALHLAAFWTAISKRSVRWFIAAGLLVGLASLTRPVAMLQPVIAALVMIPLRGGKADWKRYAAASLAQFAAFALVVLPIATAVWWQYGRFTISNGRFAVAVERMRDSPEISVGTTKVSDPELARLRDYLAFDYRRDVNTLEDIRVLIGGTTTTVARMDVQVMKLWRHYVLSHPVPYMRESWVGLWDVLQGTERLEDAWTYSGEMLETMSHPDMAPSHFLLALADRPQPSVDRMRKASRWFEGLNAVMADHRILLAVLALSVIGAVLAREKTRGYVSYLLLSTLPLYGVLFFIGTPQLRYRFPLDLLCAVLLGVAATMLRYAPPVLRRLVRFWEYFWLAGLWIVVRLPLIGIRQPPLAQIDSFSYPPFLDTLRDPHYPFLYGAFLHLFDFKTTIALQHLMVLAAALALYRVGRSAFSRAAGLLTGAYIAIHPGFVIFAHSYMSEMLFVFLFSFHLAAMWVAIRDRSLAWFFAAGILVGAACHVRPNAQLQPFIAAVVLLPVLWRNIEWKRSAAMIGCLFLGFAVVVVPVAALVKAHYGRFTISTGRYPLARDRMVQNPDMPLTAVEVDDPAMARVRDFLAVSYDRETGTLDDIRPYVDGPRTTNLRLESVITGLWRRYVMTYPWAYARDSLKGLWTTLHDFHVLDEEMRFSRKTLEQSANFAIAIHPLQSLQDWPDPDPVSLDQVSKGYAKLDNTLTFIPVVLAVLLISVIAVLVLRGDEIVFLRYVILSVFPIFVLSFFLGTPQIRYRYPFELLLSVQFGAAVWIAGRAWTKKVSITT